MVSLWEYQLDAIDKMKNGSILCGGVGSGKSRTAIAYYYLKECLGDIKINGKGKYNKPQKPRDLYIITTAKKRDSFEWEEECSPFLLSTDEKVTLKGMRVHIDSWNNIKKYVKVKQAFFIFDEQRLVGSGTWVKAFLNISRKNRWILLSATPGDTWSDYIPVFVANNFYRNRTEFLRRHAVYNRFCKYPKIDRYIEEDVLMGFRDSVLVNMNYKTPTTKQDFVITTDYDRMLFKNTLRERWDPYKNSPITSASELCYVLRKICNSHESRVNAVKEILKNHEKIIIFYNFDYELEALRNLGHKIKINTSEWNGHKHEEIPNSNKWMYLVQYTAGCEGWNCIETNTIVFYSQNYSYKVTVQAAGRIDRQNTPHEILYYYHLKSKSQIDLSIAEALRNKRNFNIRGFDSRQKHTL